jgi:CP family cyanate transporter-like MFS transporter
MAGSRRLDGARSGCELGRRLILVISVLLVAACLRPMITAVGPLVGEIQDSTGLDERALGALGALPLLAFSVVSPFVAGWAVRWGVERMVLLSLLTLAVAAVTRSTGGNVGLWVGTAVIGAAIAVGNVLVPALVKKGFPSHTTLATGAYSTVMGSFAAAGAGAALPLSASLGNWRWALGAWAAMPLLVALVGILGRGGGVQPPPAPAQALRAPRLWKSPSAWQLTIFFGLQSATFYTTITWLPTIEASFGVDPHTGGLHLLIYQVIGVIGGLAVTWLMHGRIDQRWPAFLVSLPVALAMLGFVLVPKLGLLWVVIAATGSAGSLTVALSLIPLRTMSPRETAALSGMAQSLGYFLAALGPVAAGFMASLWSSWTPTLVMIACLATIQGVLSLWVGRLEPILVLSDGARSRTRRSGA